MSALSIDIKMSERQKLEIVAYCNDCGNPIYGPKEILETETPIVKRTCSCDMNELIKAPCTPYIPYTPPQPNWYPNPTWAPSYPSYVPYVTGIGTTGSPTTSSGIGGTAATSWQSIYATPTVAGIVNPDALIWNGCDVGESKC